MAGEEKPMWTRLPTAASATLILWFVLLAFGGGCLASYYGSIGYFPKIAWEESLSYLGVLSIIGGSIVVAFGLLAFLPGVVWSEVLLSDCKLGPLLHYKRADGEVELCIRKILRIVGVPFALFILLMHACVVIAVFVHLSFASWEVIPIVIAVAILSLVLATWMFWRRVAALAGEREFGAPTAEFKFDDVDSRMAKYVAAFVISAVLSLVALLILEHHLTTDYALSAVAMWLICPVVVVFANVVVSMRFASKRGSAVLVGAFATLLLLVLGECLEEKNSLLNRVMQSYGVGERTRYVVVVTPEGRELLEAQGVPAESVSGGRGRISDAAILSRLGEEFLLCAHDRKVSLPRLAVLSWSAAAHADDEADLREGCTLNYPPQAPPNASARAPVVLLGAFSNHTSSMR